MYRYPILIICLASGFSALVCELVWSRMLVPVFGNTVFATSTVAGVFMAGLALGGFWGGRLAGPSREKAVLFRLYAMLEGGIGLFALAFPWLGDALPQLALPWLGEGGHGVIGSGLIRLAVFSFLLLPPTLLMGASFPVLGTLFIRDARKTGRDAALVYGVNTLGGTVGVLAAGFFLLQELGGRGSLVVAGGLSLCLAALAWGMAARIRVSEGGPFSREGVQTVPSEPAVASGARAAALVLTGAGLSGLCALAYEVLWARILVLVLQNSVYAFSLILAGFLAGIGLGSLLVAPVLQRRWPPLTLFGLFQVLTGLACLAVPFGFGVPDRPGDLSYLAFLLARPLFLVALPMVMSGALVPLAAAVLRRGGTGVGRTLGRVYAANSLGSVLGALLAGFCLIPLLGCRRSILVLFGAQVLFGTLVLAAAAGRRFVRAAVSVAGLLAVAAGVAFVPADLVRQRYAQAAPGEEPVYYSEGRVATASVTRDRAGHLVLSLNGIPEVTNDLPALRTFRLMALLPFVFHPDPEEAVMITFGAGISAGLAVHLFPRVACVELNERCKEIARLYRRENRDVLKAKNLTLHINDGRNFLLLSQRTLSAIIADATHPHSYDSWVLFTREFYELCRSRLDESGLFCQWLPLHGLAPQQFRTILHTVRGVFPEVSLWTVDRAYCLVLAGKRRLRLRPERLAVAVSRPDLRPFLAPVGLDNPYAVLGCFVAGRAGLARLLENETLINTDDRPYNQFFPLSATGFGRMRWHVDNLRQILPYGESVQSVMDR